MLVRPSLISNKVRRLLKVDDQHEDIILFMSRESKLSKPNWAYKSISWIFWCILCIVYQRYPVQIRVYQRQPFLFVCLFIFVFLHLKNEAPFCTILSFNLSSFFLFSTRHFFVNLLKQCISLLQLQRYFQHFIMSPHRCRLQMKSVAMKK